MKWSHVFCPGAYLGVSVALTVFIVLYAMTAPPPPRQLESYSFLTTAPTQYERDRDIFCWGMKVLPPRPEIFDAIFPMLNSDSPYLECLVVHVKTGQTYRVQVSRTKRQGAVLVDEIPRTMPVANHQTADAAARK